VDSYTTKPTCVSQNRGYQWWWGIRKAHSM